MQHLDDSSAPQTPRITTMPPPSTLRQQSASQHTSFPQTTPGVPLKRQQSTQQLPQQKQPRAGTSSSIGAGVSQKQFGSSAQSHVQQLSNLSNNNNNSNNSNNSSSNSNSCANSSKTQQQQQQQQQQKQLPVFLTPAAYAHSKQALINQTPQATSFSTTGKGKTSDLGSASHCSTSREQHPPNCHEHCKSVLEAQCARLEILEEEVKSFFMIVAKQKDFLLAQEEEIQSLQLAVSKQSELLQNASASKDLLDLHFDATDAQCKQGQAALTRNSSIRHTEPSAGAGKKSIDLFETIPATQF
ncbi:hypothetical protein DFJ73DRAFT_769525 [Zopfochytrium polystomum]|nr:hypothetical protein DFJ73DRAFT_769525 [Zopfochytrium polystomum]